ncbi:oxidoreductase [Cryptococcus deuterogattii 99/473]|uniref:Unplaced genomic scaffold supercont1.5, whole genome shotgun sequence n=1 Tax=Cryptococcus deuterogattii Ram5 TaxID=1296110 RepID=A0A0D0V502_9TREE|nr:oxidoreductase [Cryptococcus deuterogattii LA55]KIR41674.1 oxidoreductase [Cryptococcus deuterogattii Ram5]KIR71917.1 oxidoreductase [Cryptococcus deuterogattii CA1014]KIR91498.1 oxidoreductase [Cryptococcus deuterogattii CBS 10090]KIR98313.1 oxidoreductase [Cryptococcus deuterogattii 2001/935-1]KIY54929.1 oxidoreductase [Cryptococcus deuterogattii 99/473]
MLAKQLAKSMEIGMQMPRIMYGTAWKKERTAEEDLVGQAIKSLISEGVVKREELYIQTKFTSIDGQDPSLTLPYDPSSPIEEQVKQSFETSLKNLGVEYIDAVVLHSPLKSREDTLKAYLTLSRFLSTKQVRHLGISNCYDPLLLKWLIDSVAEYSSKHQEEPEVKVEIVQNRWYEGNGWDWDTLGLLLCRFRSFWTLTGSPTLLKQPFLINLAAKYGLTPEQTIYKLCQLWGITPLCGTTSLAHAKEAVSVENATGLMSSTEEVIKLWNAMGADGMC